MRVLRDSLSYMNSCKQTNHLRIYFCLSLSKMPLSLVKIRTKQNMPSVLKRSFLCAMFSYRFRAIKRRSGCQNEMNASKHLLLAKKKKKKTRKEQKTDGKKWYLRTHETCFNFSALSRWRSFDLKRNRKRSEHYSSFSVCMRVSSSFWFWLWLLLIWFASRFFFCYCGNGNSKCVQIYEWHFRKKKKNKNKTNLLFVNGIIIKS